MDEPAKKKCLNPACDRPAKTRGLCVGCYDVARGAIKSGHTTWDDLVAKGRALGPASRRFHANSKRAKAAAWLLSNPAPISETNATP